MKRGVLLCLLAVSAAQPAATTLAAPVDFDKDVAPLLAARCLECHNATDKKGKLDLTSSRATMLGGESGAVIVPGDVEKSLLWENVRDDEMPPKKPLTAAEKAMVKAWIAGGAKWGKTDPIDPYAFTTDKRAGSDWWSLRPVVKPAPPDAKHLRNAAWVKTPIDAFVLAKLESKGLSPSKEADPRVLVRRIYFNLIGLPPTPAQVEAFVVAAAKDRDAALSKLIDDLLASPHYGERWARHWLDVARYTESQGYEYDRIRPNAWHYRDYVINALNSDKPYDQFVMEQIAGDVMGGKGRDEGTKGQRDEGTQARRDEGFVNPKSEIRNPKSLPVSAESIIATSLLVCGPWDQAGNSQANQTQRKITREEEMEDLVSVISQTFLGLTANCARCHNHKFDPITQEDYFKLRSVFDGVKHGEREVAPAGELQAHRDKVASINKQISEVQARIAVIEQEARTIAAKQLSEKEEPGVKQAPPKPAGPAPLARWTFDTNANDAVGSLHGELVGDAKIANGRLIVSGKASYLRTSPLLKDVKEKTLEAWVALPTLEQGGGGVITLEDGRGGVFDSIVFAERQAKKWMAGSTGFLRTKDHSGAAETAGPDELVHMAIAYRGDNSIAVYRNGKPYFDAYTPPSPLQTYKAGDARVLIGLRHTGAGNGFLTAQVESASLHDRALSEAEIAAVFAAGPQSKGYITEAQMIAAMTDAQRRQRDDLAKEITSLRSRINMAPQFGKSYVGLREQPPVARRLLRGDVTKPAEVVAPGALSAIRVPSPEFNLKPDAPEAERRIKLAQWIADARHPLTARVMVNRVWHYHFGRGIVETPNDFGFNGARPTHPELLDWLAATFVEDGWSIKKLHKRILMSAVYRQGQGEGTEGRRDEGTKGLNPTPDTRHPKPDPSAIDADNTLLWRFTPQRLEGEIVRDAMLAVSGQLNPQLGGQSFRPFDVSNHGSDFYHLKDKIGPEFNRRSIYRMNVGSGKSPMLDALDCPDPAIKTPARRVTTTPLAALALMNNSFVQRQAKFFAQRVTEEAGGDDGKAVALAWQYAFGRSPDADEQKQALALAKEHGWETLCWALMNATEFLYVK